MEPQTGLPATQPRQTETVTGSGQRDGFGRSTQRGRRWRGRRPRSDHPPPHDSRNEDPLPSDMQHEAGPSVANTPSRGQTRPSCGGGARNGGTWRGFRGRAGAVLGTGRMFGGNLTAAHSSSEEQPFYSTLRSSAPEFIPGASPAVQANPRGSRHHARLHRSGAASELHAGVVKSTTLDLPSRIHEEIRNRRYECVICTSDVLSTSRVWTCPICWTVVHLPCVARWHQNQMQQAETAAGDSNLWRCPGCNSTLSAEPGQYHCWCGKEPNPSRIPGLPPHSCGQTCSRSRATCPHPCRLDCHAGPCPPCDLVSPPQDCFCTKSSRTKLCSEMESDSIGWSCGQMCDSLSSCSSHPCTRVCHSGTCDTCETQVLSSCYCGRVEKSLSCALRDEGRKSYNYVQNNDRSPKEIGWFEGSFSCTQTCGRDFDCAVHSCSKSCHPQDEHSTHCPLSPDRLKQCPCGKTDLGQLLDQARTKCTDPVPSCGKVCGRILLCGHLCQASCHAAACDPCTQIVDLTCRCGRPAGQSICSQRDGSPPTCVRVCQSQMSCGRHQCGQRCCAGEKRALGRAVARRKHRTSTAAASASEIEAEHICLRVCGRLLKCGSHTCQQLCHKGACTRCILAIFTEISCACGQTVLLPPNPCGSRAPDCRFDCARARACGHPQLQHNCHADEVACPNCPFLVTKTCLCGKQSLKNQPCWFEDARCGIACGKALQCSDHFCKDTCHRAGQCQDSSIKGSHCTQPCGKPRTACGHACADQCHAPHPCYCLACKEDVPCKAQVLLTCSCRSRKQEARCGSTKTKNRSVGAGSDARPPSVKCDDECLRLQRNRRLAEALNIDIDTHTDDHVPYADITLQLYRENVEFGQTYERELRVFGGDGDERRLRLKPMPRHQRAFIHTLAEDFGFDSESQDPEPLRHVCLFKTARFVSAPRKTLAQCVKIRTTQAVAAEVAARATASTAAAATTNGATARAELALNALVLVEPRFGLTVDDVSDALAADLAVHRRSLVFTTLFLQPSEDVIVRATPRADAQPMPSAAAVEAVLMAVRAAVTRSLVKMDVAKGAVACHADEMLRITRRDDGGGGGGGAAEGGWSAVVGRAAQKAARQEAGADATEAQIPRHFVALKKVWRAEDSAAAPAMPDRMGLLQPSVVVAEEPVEDDWMVAAEKLELQDSDDTAEE